jgi:uncharacterized protein YkwD
MTVHISSRLTALACTLIFAGCGGGGGGDGTSDTSTSGAPTASPTIVINTADREAVRNSYNNVFVAQSQVPMNWTGSYDSGNAGSPSTAYQQAAVGRINWFRAMAGIPANVQLSPDKTAKAQQAAFMMSANGQMSHYPPTSWRFYTAGGAEAAGNSNLDMTRAGAVCIAQGYMMDLFNGNVIHRRWLLNPQLKDVGIGDVPGDGKTYKSANATWVLAESGSKTRPPVRDGFVAWPPPGPVPYQTTYGRWSFSYPDAVFKNASVSITLRGAAVPVKQDTVQDGPGENTIAWLTNNVADYADWPRPAQDDVYEVTISNVIIGGVARSFQYKVTVFDPQVAK